MRLIDALRYKSWADTRTLDAAARIDAPRYPQQEAFIRQQLNHMVRVEEVFRARLLAQPEPHTNTNSSEVPPLHALRQRLEASNHWLQAYTPSLTPDTLAETHHFRFLDGQNGRLDRAEILFHLINHGTYHRGAIGHALDQAGGLRPADTYTVCVHEAEVERRNAR